jgi:hypothetical protein
VSGHAVAIDAPGTVCAFQTRHCSTMIDGAGGFDRHHPIPKEMGGADRQVYLVLCPTHHRRQHALIRLHCELDSYELPRLHRWHAPEERRAARAAYRWWVEHGRPRVQWDVPATRVSDAA